MSQDLNVSVKFNVNASQLKKMFAQLNKLNTKIRSMGKSMNKLGGNIKRLDSKFNSASNKSKKFTKALKSQESKQKRTAASLQRLTKNTNRYNKATKKTGRGSQAAAGGISLLGFRMLALGSTASFAGDMLKRFFIDIVREGVEDLGAMNRAIVQSGINLENFLGGDLREFDVVGERIKDLQQIFGEFTRADVGSAFEQIGRAFPSSTSLDDIEKVTENLLKMARIDKTEGAGLPKTAVDLRRVMVQFGIGAKDLDVFLDKLVNVNQQGAIELNQLVSSLGFAGAQMQRFGLDINESLALTGFFFEKGGRKAGAAGRTFGNVINKLASLTTALNPNIRAMGIEIIDAAGEYNSFTDIINQSREAFAKMKAEGKGQIFETALLEEFGFSAIEIRGFLSLMQATEEELAELQAGVEQVGTANLLSDSLGEGASVQLKTFENELRNLKAEFASGLIPVFKTFTNAVRLFSQDKEFVAVLKQFGETMGSTVVGGLNLVIPPLKFFSNILKDNTSLVKFLATATVVLVGALTAMGIIFLVAGSVAMLISVYQKLMEKSKLLRTATMFLSKTFSRLLISLKKVAIGMVNVFRGVGQKIVGGITSGIKFLIPKFIAIGARAGLFFGAAFNILANAFIGAGAWLKRLALRLGTIFAGIGAAGGSAFGTAFTAASGLIISAGSWILGLLRGLVLKFGLTGAGVGGAFGTTFIIASSAIMGAGAWLNRLFVSIGAKIVLAGGFIGAAFGTVWTVAAGLIMSAKAWLIRVFTRIGIGSALAGTVSGTAFGVAFIGALAIAIIGAGDVILENLTGRSFVREITKAIFGGTGISVLDALGIPLQGDTILGGPQHATELFKQNERLREFGGGIGPNLPGIPEVAIPSLPEAFGEVGGAEDQNEALKQIQEANIIEMQKLEEQLLKLDIESALLTGSMTTVTLDLSQFANSIFTAEESTDEIVTASEQVVIKLGEQSEGIIKAVEAQKELTSIEKKLAAEQARALEIFDSSKIQGIDKGFVPSRQATAVSSEDIESLRKFSEQQGLAGDQLIAFNLQLAESIEHQQKLFEEERIELENAIKANQIKIEQSEIVEEVNSALETNNVVTSKANVLMLKQNTKISTHTVVLEFLINVLKIDIVEVIKNTNMISSLTTTIAVTQLMFANLIAQGNRAAGKLSSLRVSKTGKFSISDPGVSSSDRSFINQAQSALATARNEQVFLSQDIDIIINPSITVENANGENVSEIADSIANELESTLQKRIGSIVST